CWLSFFFPFASSSYLFCLFFFFFNDPATTEIYTLSLHDALPISGRGLPAGIGLCSIGPPAELLPARRPLRARCTDRQSSVCAGQDRKSTRLNSSHLVISYAVFCLKKKKNKTQKKTKNKKQTQHKK